ncbi:hypothetical protein ZWY2020_025706 [Hordeum vulgare]|nr:hypothetical protein ZWY2020_025706 [Hordeum vulgare]
MFRSGICPRTTCGGTEGTDACPLRMELLNHHKITKYDALCLTLLVIVPCYAGARLHAAEPPIKERCLWASENDSSRMKETPQFVLGEGVRQVPPPTWPA